MSATPAPVAHTPGPWTCFHCGETFTTRGLARDHFGFDPSCDPACRIKVGAERGLVMALRKAEADCDEMRGLLHDEASEAYRLYAAQATRHRDQVMTAEEHGYERGLADGRGIAAAEGDLLGDCLDQIRAALAELDNVTASTDTEADYLGCAENRLRDLLSRAGKLKGADHG